MLGKNRSWNNFYLRKFCLRSCHHLVEGFFPNFHLSFYFSLSFCILCKSQTIFFKLSTFGNFLINSCTCGSVQESYNMFCKMQLKISVFFSVPNSQPRNLDVISKTSTELELSWDAPPMMHWNSERLSYKVGYRYIYRAKEH